MNEVRHLHVWYEHHGARVAVRYDLIGKHNEYCLCQECDHFVPEDRERNCNRANLLYALCVQLGMVTPVWECPAFIDIRNVNSA
jgi:hypothetical protein